MTDRPELALSWDALMRLSQISMVRESESLSAMCATALAAHDLLALLDAKEAEIDRIQVYLSSGEQEILASELRAIRRADTAERQLAHAKRVFAQVLQDDDGEDAYDNRKLLETAFDPLPEGAAITRYEREVLERQLAKARDRIAELERHRKEAGDALLKLTPGGSEYFVRDGDGYRVDVRACMAIINHKRERAWEALKGVVLARRELAEAHAEIETLRKALEPFATAFDDYRPGLNGDLRLGATDIRLKHLRRAAAIRSQQGEG